jgi:hypothetical protein
MSSHGVRWSKRRRTSGQSFRLSCSQSTRPGRQLIGLQHRYVTRGRVLIASDPATSQLLLRIARNRKTR